MRLAIACTTLLALAASMAAAPATGPTTKPGLTASKPYEVKGDALGMSLDDFKKKYKRRTTDNPRDPQAPFCSDAKPDKDISTLLYKKEMGKLGIVNARTTYPYEENRPKPVFPTIAGANASLFLHHFIDGKLYQVTIQIDHDDFDKVMTAIKSKYGEPTGKETRKYQNGFGATFQGEVLVWKNDVSQIFVFERAGKVNTSLILLRHSELSKLADERLASIDSGKGDL